MKKGKKLWKEKEMYDNKIVLVIFFMLGSDCLYSSNYHKGNVSYLNILQ